MRRIILAAALGSVLLLNGLSTPVASQPNAAAAGQASRSPGYPLHSSDGVAGPIAAPREGQTSSTAARRTAQVSWAAGPGLTYRAFTQTDDRGPVRVHQLSGRLSRTLKIRYLGHEYVRGRGPLTRLVERNRAVGGINGDFFDISGVGAPLGVGVAGHRLLHGPSSAPNAAFFIDAQGNPGFGSVSPQLPVRSAVTVTPSHLNAPRLEPLDLGVYTPAWGNLTGLKVFGGERPVSVREVWIRAGRVVENRARLSQGRPVAGRVLIGRGYRARDLRALEVGTRVEVGRSVAGNPIAAITSNTLLLRDGVVTVGDDKQLHPRSAIAYNADTQTVSMVAVDGRSARSRGMTLLEFANLLRSLGMTDALNLDGGGSTTLVARDAGGTIGVRNRPSDGRERPIPNGLGFVVVGR